MPANALNWIFAAPDLFMRSSVDLIISVSAQRTVRRPLTQPSFAAVSMTSSELTTRFAFSCFTLVLFRRSRAWSWLPAFSAVSNCPTLHPPAQVRVGLAASCCTKPSTGLLSTARGGEGFVRVAWLVLKVSEVGLHFNPPGRTWDYVKGLGFLMHCYRATKVSAFRVSATKAPQINSVAYRQLTVGFKFIFKWFFTGSRFNSGLLRENDQNCPVCAHGSTNVWEKFGCFLSKVPCVRAKESRQPLRGVCSRGSITVPTNDHAFESPSMVFLSTSTNWFFSCRNESVATPQSCPFTENARLEQVFFWGKC